MASGTDKVDGVARAMASVRVVVGNEDAGLGEAGLLNLLGSLAAYAS